MNTFFLIFLILPALEIFLMIKIGGEIGALNTVGLIFLTAFVGIFLCEVSRIANFKIRFNKYLSK